jgi:hypothetical protein
VFKWVSDGFGVGCLPDAWETTIMVEAVGRQRLIVYRRGIRIDIRIIGHRCDFTEYTASAC